MKKLLFLCLALTAFTLSANAQKVTEKNLTGRWNIKELDLFGAYMNFKKDSVSVSKQLVEALGKTTDETKAMIRAKMSGIKSDHLIFRAGSIVEYRIFTDMNETTTYKLEERDGKQFLQIVGEGEGHFISIKNGDLYLETNSQQGNLVMIFEKLK